MHFGTYRVCVCVRGWKDRDVNHAAVYVYVVCRGVYVIGFGIGSIIISYLDGKRVSVLLLLLLLLLLLSYRKRLN